MNLRDYLAQIAKQAYDEEYARRTAAAPQPLPVKQVTPPEQIAVNSTPSMAYWDKFQRSVSGGSR